MRESMERLGSLWCGVMHDVPMWPIHGQYECRRCGRRRPVAWDAAGMAPARRSPMAPSAVGRIVPFGLRKRTV
jgi:hypothetical protein